MRLSWTTDIVRGSGMEGSGGLGGSSSGNSGVDVSIEAGSGKGRGIMEARRWASMLAANANKELVHFRPSARRASVRLAMAARARRAGFPRGLRSH
jgi:hypothetical protein